MLCNRSASLTSKTLISFEVAVVMPFTQKDSDARIDEAESALEMASEQENQPDTRQVQALIQENEVLKDEITRLKARVHEAESGVVRLKKASKEASQRLGASIGQLKLVLEA